MIQHIVCPSQTTEDFTVEKCVGCRYFEASIGKSTTVKCRKNRSPQHRRSFEMVVLTNKIGRPDQVIVEATEEPKKG